MILECHNLTRTFRRQGQDFAAVKAVDISLSPGEFAVITGPSGCGKSTLFNLLTGLLSPTSGQILLNGQDLSTYRQKQWEQIRAQEIAYILQGHNLLDNLTVRDNICLPKRLVGLGGDLNSKAHSLLAEFGLAQMAEEYPANLSFGERRRVAIARAFVGQPQLVLADEPTSDLDPVNARLVMDFFQRRAQEGQTILISSHKLEILAPELTHYKMTAGELELVTSQN
ncbi:MAG: ABC transporter ATP-binding protein [Eubacteriales bacterium]|nr:ABC transporter ATP-binding protein [Eubacteriales bacterium]